jgi:hypothetical protein
MSYLNFENYIDDELNNSRNDYYSSVDNRYDDDYYEPYLCISCNGDSYPLTVDDKCERCWRSAFTILEISCPINTDLMNHIFSFLDIEINHVKRVQEYKSRDKICWRFKKHGKCKLGDFCRFVHIVKSPTGCRHFLRGDCRFKDICHFTHRSPTLCRLFLKGFCQFGEMCRFTHRSQKICKWFLKGQCHFGKKCYFTHKR